MFLIAAFVFLLAGAGCGAPGGSSFEPLCFRTDPTYYQECQTSVGVEWTSVSFAEARGGLWASPFNAKLVVLELWHSTPSGEVKTIVRPPNGVVPMPLPPLTFVAAPQITNGEPRFPRIGLLTWGGGSRPAQPRAPAVAPDSVWCRVGTDSLRGYLKNSAGWAYHVVARVETRDGVLDLPVNPDRFGPGQLAYFQCTPRDSAGVVLAPKILRIQWEDYGGIAGGVDFPGASNKITDCN